MSRRREGVVVKTVICDEAGLAETAAVLNAGGVAVIPTDTVYGFAARPDCPAAVERLYSMKGRDPGKPVALLAAGFEEAERFLGGGLPAAAGEIARRHWPGALTLVLPKCGEDGVYEGLRMPAHDWTRRLIAACGGVLRVTSANASGGDPALDAASAVAAAGDSADIAADGGVSPGGVASTVAKCDGNGAISILRQGPVAL